YSVWSSPRPHAIRRARGSSVDTCFFFSSRRRHTRSKRDWSSDVCSSDLGLRDLGVFTRELVRDLIQKVRGVAELEQELHPCEVRSEERRVGKECRGRWALSQYKKKKRRYDDNRSCTVNTSIALAYYTPSH